MSAHHVQPNTPAIGRSLRAVTDIGKLDEIESDWDRLVPKTAAPFQQFGWVRAWYRAYDVEPCVLVMSENGITRAILPGYIEQKRFRLAGDASCDYQDLIAHSGCESITTFLKMGMKWLRENSKVAYFYFEKLSSEGILHEFLTGCEHPVDSSLTFKKSYAPCPRVSLAGGLDGYLSALPGKLRQDLRRSLRRLEKAMPDAVHQIDRAPTARDVREAATYHVEHFRKGGESPLADRRLVDLLCEAADDPSVGLQLSTLSSGGVILARDIGFAPRGAATYYGYLTAFDPEFHKLAPGKCHMLLRLDEWVDLDGVEFLDFLAGDEAYKLGLTLGEGYQVDSIHLMPSGLVDRVRQATLTVEQRGRLLAKQGLEKSGFLNR